MIEHYRKNVIRVTSFAFGVTVLVASLTTTSMVHADERPNIIFFLIDDCSPHYFGCYGNEKGLTPNIDQLATDGIRFKTAWACPLCWPTRTLLMSGQYGFKTGAYCNGIFDPKKSGYPFTT